MTIGAALGYASTLLDSDEGPVVNYWNAGQVLIADNDAEAQINLVRIGPEAVLGSIPVQVAEEYGVEPAELGLRAVADTSSGTLTISAISVEDPAIARNIAADVVELFVESVVAEDLADYQRQLQLLQTETRTQQQRIDEAQETIDELNARIVQLDEGESLTPSQQDRLSRANGTRSNAEAAYAAAADQLEALIVQGAPESPLSFLQEVTPTRISESAYRQRIAQAGQAANTFNAGSQSGISDAAASSPSDRLESPITRAVLGAIAGFVVGLMLVIVQARLDTRLRDRAGFEAAFGLPVIAEVPTIKRSDRKANVLHAVDKPYSQITEAHRYIRSVLLFARATQEGAVPAAPAQPASRGADAGEDAVRVVMVTSAGEGEGKTTTAANLAVMMAEAGYDTLLVNCDHRRPRMHELFGVPYTPGTVTETALPHLQLITDVPRGDDETPARIAEHQRNVIRNARQQVDVVILDTAPILATNDALDLVADTDLVLLVARASSTTRGAAVEARELLIDRMGVPVTGVVVTHASSGLGGRYYDRAAYGGYYGPVAAGTTAAAARPDGSSTNGTAPGMTAPDPGAATDDEAASADTPVTRALPFEPPLDDPEPASVDDWLDRLMRNGSSASVSDEPDRVVNIRSEAHVDDEPEVRRGRRG